MRRIFNAVIYPIIETLIRNIAGNVGVMIRERYYRRRFRSAGAHLHIATNVVIKGAEYITAGETVYIDENSVVVAGAHRGENVKRVPNPDYQHHEGELVIGNGVHLGVGAIIQAHGGIHIHDHCTTSAGCKLYTLSNDVTQCHNGTTGERLPYILKPIVLERNVWLGLNVCVVGGTVGADSFAQPNTVITHNTPPNAILRGFPAQVIKQRFYQ